MTRHLVLLGDSIFDNGVYVPGGPAVIDHLRRMIPASWRATLLAQDGATVATTMAQVPRIPADATSLIVSVGGNDGLWLAGNLFAERVETIRAALELLGDALAEFRGAYLRLLHELRLLNVPLTLCTVYDAVPGLTGPELAGLGMINDVVTRAAFQCRCTLIDLRVICREKSDYSSVSPIEPSASGGGKIARAILSAVDGSEPALRVIA